MEVVGKHRTPGSKRKIMGRGSSTYGNDDQRIELHGLSEWKRGSLDRVDPSLLKMLNKYKKISMSSV